MGLRDMRTQRGMTQTDLADKANTSQVTISEYERGVKNPRKMTLEYAYRLADALDCEPREFLK